jgi:hypothetical protein
MPPPPYYNAPPPDYYNGYAAYGYYGYAYPAVVAPTLYFGGGYYPQYYRRPYGRYNWGYWHH